MTPAKTPGWEQRLWDAIPLEAFPMTRKDGATMKAPAPAAPFANAEYTPVAFIRNGAFGSVWIYDQRHVGLVAIKFVRLPADPEAATRVVNEAAYLRTYGRNNPNIVQIYGLIPVAPDVLGIVMEFLNAPAFDQVIQTNGRIEGDLALKFLDDLSCALRAFHEPHDPNLSPLVYQDVKPSNCLLVAYNSRVQLKLIDGSVVGPIKDFGGHEGAILYHAPEASRTPKSDYWAVGLMLFEMHFGLLLGPFAAAHVPAAEHNQGSVRRVKLREAVLAHARSVPDADQRVVKLLTSLLDINPVTRAGHNEIVQAQRTATAGVASPPPPSRPVPPTVPPADEKSEAANAERHGGRPQLKSGPEGVLDEQSRKAFFDYIENG